MTIRDREEQGEQRFPVSVWGVCSWGKPLALYNQKGMGQGASSRWDHQVEGPHLHGQKITCLLVRGVNPWNLKINSNFASLKLKTMTITHFSNQWRPERT